MRWKRVSNYALLSECEQYSVAEVFQRDVARYEAWRTALHPARRGWIAVKLASAEEAQRACEEYSRGKHDVSDEDAGAVA